MTTKAPLCVICKHIGDGLDCKAFPKGIPEKILLGQDKHKKKLKNQKNDVVYELDKEKLKQFGVKESDFD
jgi:hypothetical protein